jgi:phosphatidylglycerophosphate synthase
LQPHAAGASERDMRPGNQGTQPFSAASSPKLCRFDESRQATPPSRLEIGAFWIVGILITVASGNQGFFQPLERPALAWLARKVPTSITPDHLTAIGFGGAVIAAVAYAASGSRPGFLWLASLGLVINWFGDSLDGTVARLRRIERPRYGYYLDNAVDCIAALLLAAGIGLSGYVRFDLCLLALVAYLMVSTLSFIRANVSNVFQLAHAAVGPTEVRSASLCSTPF